MRKQFIAAFALVAVTSASTSIHAQNFGSFKAGISELSMNGEVVLEKEADAVQKVSDENYRKAQNKAFYPVHC